MANNTIHRALRLTQFAAVVLCLAACSNKPSGPEDMLTGTVIPGASAAVHDAGSGAAATTDQQTQSDPGSVGQSEGAAGTSADQPPPAMTQDVAGRPGDIAGSGGAPAMPRAGAGGSASTDAGTATNEPPPPDDDDIVPDAGMQPDSGTITPPPDDDGEPDDDGL